MNTITKIGKRIRYAREKAGLKQQELADLIRVKPYDLSYVEIEIDTIEDRSDKMKAIVDAACEALDTTLTELAKIPEEDLPVIKKNKNKKAKKDVAIYNQEAMEILARTNRQVKAAVETSRRLLEMHRNIRADARIELNKIYFIVGIVGETQELKDAAYGLQQILKPTKIRDED